MKWTTIIAFFLFLTFLSGCKENTYIYEINDVLVLPNNSEKDKEKSVEQFLNILYANMYQQALSPEQLVDLTNVVASIGDKQVAFETITAKFMKDPNVILPSNGQMRNDIPTFVDETYRRFFVREPSKAERTFFVNFIESHPNISPEHIYFSFATSDEYYYY